MVTKVELLAEAKELGLEDTDGLNKAALEAAVEAARPAAEVVEEAPEPEEDAEVPQATTTQGGLTALMPPAQ